MLFDVLPELRRSGRTCVTQSHLLIARSRLHHTTFWDAPLSQTTALYDMPILATKYRARSTPTLAWMVRDVRIRSARNHMRTIAHLCCQSSCDVSMFQCFQHGQIPALPCAHRIRLLASAGLCRAGGLDKHNAPCSLHRLHCHHEGPVGQPRCQALVQECSPTP